MGNQKQEGVLGQRNVLEVEEGKDRQGGYWGVTVSRQQSSSFLEKEGPSKGTNG